MAAQGRANLQVFIRFFLEVRKFHGKIGGGVH